MNRRGRRIVNLFEHSRCEAQRMTNEDRTARLVGIHDARVVSAHHGRERPKHQRQAFPAVPEIGMLRQAIEFFFGVRSDEPQSRTLADGSEWL